MLAGRSGYCFCGAGPSAKYKCPYLNVRTPASPQALIMPAISCADKPSSIGVAKGLVGLPEFFVDSVLLFLTFI